MTNPVPMGVPQEAPMGPMPPPPAAVDPMTMMYYTQMAYMNQMSGMPPGYPPYGMPPRPPASNEANSRASPPGAARSQPPNPLLF